MSKIGISIKLDLKKIDKARLFAAQSGALYLDLTMFVDPDNEGQYGDHGIVTQTVSKEERDQNVQMPIAGNGKIFYGLQELKSKQPQQAPQQPQPQQQQQPQQSWKQPQQRPQAPQQPARQGAYNANQPQSAQGFDDFDDSMPF